MDDARGTALASRSMELAKRMPFLSDFAEPLRLNHAEAGTSGSFDRMCELLGAPSEALRVTFHLTDGGQSYAWRPARAGASSAAPSAPADVEVLATPRRGPSSRTALSPRWRRSPSGGCEYGVTSAWRRFVRHLRHRDEMEER